ncbi:MULTISPECIES: cobyrinate a,c-diamide synthase [unclassified Dysgonomonas]|uniref:cobyrinate a,c-diamide synthase n=1 Tax=unclassified Dysgonomonas TaxID=2630389 RepID=UPI000680BE8A|nr:MULTISPECIES: cobyrinate a,c-diamide synthase [unclassified Dysgonomonas]MBD8346629.1 cobyrinate a,c-diamide synthase [Dysgonomonas sp. HGC4]MBF0574454.1 cobyrinate a,c-diamide synthase [Dysgonomonas sp. GY617]
MDKTSRFLISATTSGSGKTTLTLGLLRALKNRGLKTQPFKCGPDYIDTKYHDMASGNHSINLDVFLASTHHVESLYSKYATNKDACIVEGVMGLYDGYNRMQGSSAQIAELLDIPVVLVINAKSMAYSAAALLFGFKNFYKNINVVGVIFNFVASDSHYSYLKDACEDVGLEALGYLPKDTNVEIPSRHLGLNIEKEFIFDEFANKVAALIEKHINVDRLLEITATNKITNASKEEEEKAKGNLNIAVAYDEAFNFIYHENIEHLKKLGNVSFFSPIKDKELPLNSDLVYLPGGYPELYLKELSSNTSMLESIRSYIENEGKLIAECGGMMYLCTSIADKEGIEYPMVDILKQTATMQHMRLKLGYRSFTYKGQCIKGHEFHYSKVEDPHNNTSTVTQIHNAKGTEVDTKLIRYKNTIAGYTHIYWSELDLMKLFE